MVLLLVLMLFWLSSCITKPNQQTTSVGNSWSGLTNSAGTMSPRVSSPPNCIGEGQHNDIMNPNAQCCAGLTAINSTGPDYQPGPYFHQCVPTAPSSQFYCTRCGNGQCSTAENVCNCPSDCAWNFTIIPTSLTPDVIVADVKIVSLSLHGNVTPQDTGTMRIDHIFWNERHDGYWKQYNPQYRTLQVGEVKPVRFLFSARPAKLEIASLSLPPAYLTYPLNIGLKGDIVPIQENGYYIYKIAGLYNFLGYDAGAGYFWSNLHPINQELILSGVHLGDVIHVIFSYNTSAQVPLVIGPYIAGPVCGKEGDLIDAKTEYCCDGQTKIETSALQNGTCLPTTPPNLFYCTTCGNGMCDTNQHENLCNCPSDCH
ncbi:hypothetical protein HZB02_02560 [Candidatus Woesearchaeota archaeon]|nr:hypothetical protein [Candidatus Woesearchaeota archaeon]